MFKSGLNVVFDLVDYSRACRNVLVPLRTLIDQRRKVLGNANPILERVPTFLTRWLQGKVEWFGR